MECDRALGTIIRELSRSGIRDQVRIFVTTDHGFDEGMCTHLRAPHGWLASDVPLAGDGHLEDVAATVYAALGVPLGDLFPPLLGHPLTRSMAAWPEAEGGGAGPPCSVRRSRS
jgi:hypothetical protein